MKRKQVKYWQAYVDQLKNHLRLTDWLITVQEQTAEEGNDAQIKIMDDYQTANIYLSDDFNDQPPWKQRLVLIHELTHCRLNRLARFAESLAHQLGAQARELALEQITHYLEESTEELSRAILPYLPLPGKKS